MDRDTSMSATFLNGTQSLRSASLGGIAAIPPRLAEHPGLYRSVQKQLLEKQQQGDILTYPQLSASDVWAFLLEASKVTGKKKKSGTLESNKENLHPALISFHKLL